MEAVDTNIACLNFLLEYLLPVRTDVESVATHVDPGYASKGVRLSAVPELDRVVPTACDQLVRRFRVETGTEDPRPVTVHHFQ